MNKKRLISMMTAIMLTMTNVFAEPLLVTSLASSEIQDLPDGWSKQAVEEAIQNDVLVARDGFIRPTDPLTRAEMALGINNAFGAEEKADISKYTDVFQDKWYYEEMQKAVAMGTFSGYEDNTLKPEYFQTRNVYCNI